MTDYDNYPDHTLYGVPQEVLDVAREVMRDAVAWKDVAPDMAAPLADAVVAELLESGRMVVVNPEDKE